MSQIGRRCAFVAVALVACGDSGNRPSDAGADSGSLGLTAEDGSGGNVSMLAFDPTLVGQSSSLTVALVNHGSVETGPIALSVSGPAAADYFINSAQTTCTGVALPAAGQCVVVLQFRPTAGGTRTATLSIASASGGSVSIALSGSSSVPDLHFVPALVEVPAMQAGSSTSRVVELRNDGTTSLTLQNLQVTGAAFSRATSTCTGSLAAHTSCDISIVVAPTTIGVLTGVLHVTSDRGTFAAPLKVTGARGLTVTKVGNGSGRIAATDVGIDCGFTCTALVTSAVTLTATAEPGSALTGWSIPQCGANATCVVPLDVLATTVTATFAQTGTASITLAFAGTGAGEARIHGIDADPVVAPCYSTCTIPAKVGEKYAIEVSTWSQFAGFSGATCTPGTPQGMCELTATAGTTTVTLTFNKRPGERYTRFLAETPSVVTFDADENLIVALPGGQLIKLSPLGATLWAIPFAATAIGTGPQNSIYVVGTHNADTGLFRLDASGMVLWHVPIPAGYNARVNTSSFATTLAVASDGSAVSIGGSGIVRWDNMGNVSWSVPLGFDTVGGVGLQPDGTVVVGRRTGDSAVNRDVVGERFAAADGAPLSSLGSIGTEWSGDLEVDGAGNVATHNSGGKNVYFTWRSHVVFNADPFPIPRNTGTCITGTNEAVYVVDRNNNQGYQLGRMAADGTVRESTTVDLFDAFGVERLNDMTCSRTSNAYAVGGEYKGFTARTGFVQRIDP